MTTFVFAYDLRDTAGKQDYKPLWDNLEKLGGQRVQESLWLVNLENQPSDIIEHFKTFAHKDDRLWVSELTSVRSFSNSMSGTKNWLSENPPTR